MTKNPSKASAILTEYKEVAFYLDKIIQQLQPEKVILYGSKATGKANQYSDTDIAVTGVKNFDTTEIFGAVDIVEFEKAPDALKEKIEQEGILLYESRNG